MKYVRTSPRKMRRVIDMIRGQHVVEARRILRSMARREVRTKVALGIFAVVLVGIIIGLIVWLVKREQ